MITYKKSDQYYEDEYDRVTIEHLKEIENRIKLAGSDKLEVIKLQVLYNDFGAHQAGKRDGLIAKRKASDEYRDIVIGGTPIPKGIHCNSCSEEMFYETLSFTSEEKLVFYFACRHDHFPKRAIYSDGTELYIKPRICTYCSGPIETKKKQTKTKIVFTDKCKYCGKIEVQELDLTERKRPEITEEDRLKYCISFIGSRTLQQDMQLILDNAYVFDEVKNMFDYSHVKQINIAQLENMLLEEIEKIGFIKVQFEKPKSGRYLTIEFSTQDSLSRDETSSVKAIKRTINKLLFPTNWRLMATGITYKLGFITGELKGYSTEEDLIKIGKEINDKQKGQKQTSDL